MRISDWSSDVCSSDLVDTACERETVFFAVTGCLLPLWSRMPSSRITVYQMTTDDGQRILARVLSQEWADNFVQRVHAAAGGGSTAGDALATIELGEFASLRHG